MNSKSLVSLLELLEKCNTPPYRPTISQADMDEIVLLTQASFTCLPERFVSLVKDLDGLEEITSNDASAYLARLLRMINFAIQQTAESDSEVPSEALLPTFHLSDSDHARVMELCTQMRKIIFASEVFDNAHKRRLLDRIAAIEWQLKQERGLFDIVRGGINDLGETLGKFGTDIKPLTDRMTEVVKITRKSTKEYDKLPAPDEIKRLPPPEDE